MYDLGSYDDDFAPAEPAVAMTKAEELTDGNYEWEVKKAAIKHPKGHVILELALEVISAGKHAGAVIQHSLFMDDRDGVARVGRDLLTLGFDTDQWLKAKGRPFSQEFPKAVKLLPGLRVKGQKKTNEKKEKGVMVGHYHNIYLNERLATDGRPAHFGPEELAEVAQAAKYEEDPFG